MALPSRRAPSGRRNWRRWPLLALSEVGGVETSLSHSTALYWFIVVMLVLAVAWGNLENRDDVISRAVTYYPGDAESGASFGTEFSFDATTIGTNRSSHTRTFSMGNSYEIIETVSEESEQEEKEEHGKVNPCEVCVSVRSSGACTRILMQSSNM